MKNGTRSTLDFDGFYANEYQAIARAAWFVVLDIQMANDIAQEAFCRALQRWDRVEGYERPGAWVRTVAIRLALRARERRRRETVLVDVAVADTEAASELSADLAGALRGLPRQQRAAVVLHYLCDLSVEQLAEVMGCRAVTARVHLHRARKALGEQLGYHDDVAR